MMPLRMGADDFSTFCVIIHLGAMGPALRDQDAGRRNPRIAVSPTISGFQYTTAPFSSMRWQSSLRGASRSHFGSETNLAHNGSHARADPVRTRSSARAASGASRGNLRYGKFA